MRPNPDEGEILDPNTLPMSATASAAAGVVDNNENVLNIFAVVMAVGRSLRDWEARLAMSTASSSSRHKIEKYERLRTRRKKGRQRDLYLTLDGSRRRRQHHIWVWHPAAVTIPACTSLRILGGTLTNSTTRSSASYDLEEHEGIRIWTREG